MASEPISLLSDDSDDGEAAAPSLAKRLKARGAASNALKAISTAAMVDLSEESDVELQPAPSKKRARKANSGAKPLAALSPRGSRAQRSAVADDDLSDEAPPLAEGPPLATPKERAPARGGGGGKRKQAASTAASSSSAAASAAPAERPAPTAHDQQAYLAARRACVKSRRFKLSSVTSGVVSTSRTIKPMGAWAGLWPALREFMQNTIDHLHLLGSDGRLNVALELSHEPLPSGGTIARFTCGEVEVCAIRAEADALTIEQAFTYPMHPRALDTGVADRTKGGEATAGGFGDGFKTAAIALLAQPSLHAAIEWRFEVPAEGLALSWRFVGAPRAAVGTFRASQVLEVHVASAPLGTPRPRVAASAADEAAPSSASASSSAADASSSSAAAAANAAARPATEHRMVQVVRAKGIGAAFVREAMPRLQVFWALSRSSDGDGNGGGNGGDGGGGGWEGGLLSSRKGGSFLADAASQPAVPGTGSPGARPEPGLYVRGIWVRKPLIDGALMCFDGKARLDVTGRDRNDVDHDEAAEATLALLRGCEQRELLHTLCLPLKGTRAAAADAKAAADADADADGEGEGLLAAGARAIAWAVGGGRSGRGGGGGGGGGGGARGGSWLLRSPRFSNRLLETDPAYFVHEVLRVPEGAVFVSRRTTESKEPFVAWAARFLAARDAPLLPLDASAHKLLFKEATEQELEALCVSHLLKEEKDKDGASSSSSSSALGSDATADERAQERAKERADRAKAAARGDLASKLLKFVGSSKLKVHFAPALTVAFVHGSHVFVPGSQPLSRPLLVRLLGVVHRRHGGYDERFTHLQQALFELLPAHGGGADGGGGRAEVTAAQLDAVLKRAEAVQTEAKAFERTAATGGAIGGGGSSSSKRKEPPPPRPADADGGGDGGGAPGKRRAVDVDLTGGGGGGGGNGGGGGGGDGNGGGRRRGGGGGGGGAYGRADLDRQINGIRGVGGGDGGGAILPSSAFAADAPGAREECLRPASALHRTAVGDELGGGHVLCDAASVDVLSPPSALPPARRAALLLLRSALDAAKTRIGAALPRLRPTLRDVVHAGYDAKNDEYLGFCTSDAIVVNLHPLLKKHAAALSGAAGSGSGGSGDAGGSGGSGDAGDSGDSGDGGGAPVEVVRELVLTVVHEVAHLLEKGGGHGADWRATYDELIMAVCADQLGSAPGAFARQQCACCE